MNLLFKAVCLGILATCSVNAFSQKLSLEQGDLSFLKNEKSINLELTYEDMKVGKYDNEKDYVTNKQAEMNKKNPGTGDTWAKEWENDKGDRYRAKFVELFQEHCPTLKITNDGKAKYTIIYHTTFLEPGYNIGISRKNAQHNAILTVVDAADKSKVLAKITVDKALGRTMSFSDYDTGARLAETYADAAKEIGKMFEKKMQ
ncbi:hypothetical protein QEG73_14720 [Chitinophagaceae bacterium 26-R-25]|nr:hypothetical protein [Chitinophagaceae bacterium 26-R-25]